MTYRQKKIYCANRSLVFANNLTGGGDETTDPGAEKVDPNKSLAPIIGGSKTFNIVLLSVAAVAVVLLVLTALNIVQIKKLQLNAGS